MKNFGAEALGTDPSNIAKILKKSNIDVYLLVRISQALHHDFLAEISGMAGI